MILLDLSLGLQIYRKLFFLINMFLPLVKIAAFKIYPLLINKK